MKSAILLLALASLLHSSSSFGMYAMRQHHLQAHRHHVARGQHLRNGAGHPPVEDAQAQAQVHAYDSDLAPEGEPSTRNADKPTFVSSGVSWDSSRNQFFVSRTSGSSIFVVGAGTTHAVHETSANSVKRFLGMRAVRGFKAQVLHPGTSMLWRVEVISSFFSPAVENYLVGYDLNTLIGSKTLKSEISYKLPGMKDYTALTVSPNGIVFAVDAHGGIVKIDPNPTANLSFALKNVETLLPSQAKGDGSPLGIVYDDKGKFLIVAKLRSHLTLTFVEPDNGNSTVLELDTKLPSCSTNPAIYSPPQLLSLHNEYVVVLASGHIQLVRYTLGYQSSALTARIVESLKVKDGALALFPVLRDFSISLFYLSRRHNIFFHYVREYEFSAIDSSFPTNSTTSLVLSQSSFTLEKPISIFSTNSAAAKFHSFIRSHNQIIQSYSTGAMVAYDGETLLKLAELDEEALIVHKVVNQIFDESSDILWRIEKLNEDEPEFIISGYKLNHSKSTAKIASETLPLYSEPVAVALGPGRALQCLLANGHIRKYVWDAKKKHLIHFQTLPLRRKFPSGVPLVQYNAEFFVIQDQAVHELLRVHFYLAEARPIRILASIPTPSTTISTLCWGIVFLRGGRHLVIGHKHYILLLQEVTPGMRWEQARAVATIDISNLGDENSFSGLSLTSNDFEVALCSGEIWYKINVQSNQVVSPPPLLIQRDPVILWRHKFSTDQDPLHIAFDHSRKQLIVTYLSGIGIYKVSSFIPTELSTSFSDPARRFGFYLLVSSLTSWRLEFVGKREYLVPYLRSEDRFTPFWRERIELPRDEVKSACIGMSPSGILFLVGNFGRILQVDVRGTSTAFRRLTDAERDYGPYLIVCLDDRFLIVGNRRTGVLTRVDVKSGVRQPISVGLIDRGFLMGLVLLPDGRLSLLRAGRLILLQDASGMRDRPWSSADVVGSVHIADVKREQLLSLSISDPKEGTVVVLSQCREQNISHLYTIAIPRKVEGETSSFD